MKNWPTDPIAQHNRFISAFCEDLMSICLEGKQGTPRTDRVCEINRQVNSSTRDAVAANNRPATDQ